MNSREIIIKKLKNVLKGQIMYIKDDESISDKDKLIQLSIVEELTNHLLSLEKSNENELNR